MPLKEAPNVFAKCVVGSRVLFMVSAYTRVKGYSLRRSFLLTVSDCNGNPFVRNEQKIRMESANCKGTAYVFSNLLIILKVKLKTSFANFILAFFKLISKDSSGDFPYNLNRNFSDPSKNLKQFSKELAS